MSVLSLVSYDYRFLLSTISRYLSHVDEVVLGIDSEGLTWSGEPFAIPGSFFDQLRRLDQRPPKIRLASQPFYSASRSPMENDVAERNALSLEVQEGNWIVSIDADEYLVNPSEFFGFLRQGETDGDVCVEGQWITVFKDLGGWLLVVAAGPDGLLERFPIATLQRGAFRQSRWTEARPVLSPCVALHYSWGRQEEDLRQKLLNWSHSQDFDVRSYFEFWRGINETNYATIRNFHPIWPTMWSRLVLVEKADLENWDLWDLEHNAGPSVVRAARRVWRQSRRVWRGRRQ